MSATTPPSTNHARAIAAIEHTLREARPDVYSQPDMLARDIAWDLWGQRLIADDDRQHLQEVGADADGDVPFWCARCEYVRYSGQSPLAECRARHPDQVFNLWTWIVSPAPAASADDAVSPAPQPAAKTRRVRELVAQLAQLRADVTALRDQVREQSARLDHQAREHASGEAVANQSRRLAQVEARQAEHREEVTQMVVAHIRVTDERVDHVFKILDHHHLTGGDQ